MSSHAEALAGLFAAFRQPLDDITAKVWLRALDGLSEADVDRACLEVARREEYLPSPAVVIRYAGQAERDQAPLAFERCRDQIRSGFKMDLPARDERAVKIAGGWDALCDMTDKNRDFVRKRYIEAWVSVGRLGAEDLRRIDGKVGGLLDGLASTLGAGSKGGE